MWRLLFCQSDTPEDHSPFTSVSVWAATVVRTVVDDYQQAQQKSSMAACASGAQSV